MCGTFSTVMADDQVFLKDRSILKKLELLLKDLEEPVLEIGAGAGSITNILKDKDLTAVEMDPQYLHVLRTICGKKQVVIGRFQDLQLPDIFKTMVSNLPFNQIVDLLFHTKLNYPTIKTFYVIVPKNFHLKFAQKCPLGYKIRHNFDIKKLLTIPGDAFRPRIKFSTILLKLTVKAQHDSTYMSYLSQLTRPHKKLKNSFIKGFLNPDLLDPSVKVLLERRITDFTDDQFYELYEALKINSCLHFINKK